MGRITYIDPQVKLTIKNGTVVSITSGVDFSELKSELK